MREIEASKITEALRDMCIEASHYLSDDMKEALDKAADAVIYSFDHDFEEVMSKYN